MRRKNWWLAWMVVAVLGVTGCSGSGTTGGGHDVLDSAATFSPAPDGTHASVTACHAVLAPSDLPAGFSPEPEGPEDCKHQGVAGVAYGDATRSGRLSLDEAIEISPSAQAAQAAFPQFTEAWTGIWSPVEEQPSAQLGSLGGDQVRYFTTATGELFQVRMVVIRKGSAMVFLCVRSVQPWSADTFGKLAKTALSHLVGIH